MSRFPIVARELRVAARRSATWWLRLSATLLGLGLLGMMLGVGAFDPPNGGGDGLWGLGVIMLGIAALSGCFLTADAISSERREGTLGLLFLTPLRPRDIVLGKLVVSGLTMTFCLVALLPLLFVTMLVGGVTGLQAVNLGITVFTTLLLSLGVGLLVSALSVDSTRAAMSTLVIMTLIVLLPLLVFAVSYEFKRGGGGVGFNPLTAISPTFSLVFGWDANWNGPSAIRFRWCIATQATIGLLLVAAATRVVSWNWRHTLEPAGPRAGATGNTQPTGHDKFNERGNPYAELVGRQVQDPAWARWFRRLIWLVLLLMCGCLVLRENADLDVFLTGALCAALALHLLVGLSVTLESSRLAHLHLRSGAYEQLLATPLPGLLIVAGLKQMLGRRFRRMTVSTVFANLLVLGAVIGRQRGLRIDGEEVGIVAAFVLGGLMASLVNFSVLQWAGIDRGLRDATPLRAAFKALLIVHGLPWTMFFVVFIILANASIRSELLVAGFFFAYYVAATGFALWLGIGLRLKVKRQFRQLVAAGS